HAIRLRPKVRALTTRNDETEMLMMRRVRVACHVARSAITTRCLLCSFLCRRPRSCERASRRSVAHGIAEVPELADAAAEFVGVEVPITAVGQRSKRVVEADKRGVRTFGWSGTIPRAGERVHAS